LRPGRKGAAAKQLSGDAKGKDERLGMRKERRRKSTIDGTHTQKKNHSDKPRMHLILVPRNPNTSGNERWSALMLSRGSFPLPPSPIFAYPWSGRCAGPTRHSARSHYPVCPPERNISVANSRLSPAPAVPLFLAAFLELPTDSLSLFRGEDLSSEKRVRARKRVHVHPKNGM